MHTPNAKGLNNLIGRDNVVRYVDSDFIIDLTVVFITLHNEDDIYYAIR